MHKTRAAREADQEPAGAPMAVHIRTSDATPTTTATEPRIGDRSAADLASGEIDTEHPRRVKAAANRTATLATGTGHRRHTWTRRRIGTSDPHHRGIDLQPVETVKKAFGNTGLEVAKSAKARAGYASRDHRVDGGVKPDRAADDT